MNEAQLQAAYTSATGQPAGKVEKLPGGDDTRSYTEPSIAGESAAFMIMNRNKRGVAVNLKKPGGLPETRAR